MRPKSVSGGKCPLIKDNGVDSQPLEIIGRVSGKLGGGGVKLAESAEAQGLAMYMKYDVGLCYFT